MMMGRKNRTSDKQNSVADSHQPNAGGGDILPRSASTPLDEDLFFSLVVPAFNEARDELVRILKKDAKLATKLAAMRLVIVDNRATDNRMLFWLTDTYKESCYLYDQHHGMRGIHGYGTSEITMAICDRVSILDALRSVFLGELLSRAKPEDLASYLEKFLRSNYADVQTSHTSAYYLLRVANLEFGVDGLFTIAAYRRNLVIPLVPVLKAADIPDSSGGNKKILFTTSDDTSGYQGFDRIVDYWGVFTHLTVFTFSYAVPLYQRLTCLDASALYEAVAYLKTTGSMEIFDLKRELATVPLSDGKRFEQCLEKVLETCMQPSYEKFRMKKQVPNRGRLAIRDFIITNDGSTHSFLKMLELRGVQMLLFDAKNYGKKLQQADIDRFKVYLDENRAFGNFGVILSKRGAAKNCDESIFRASIATHNSIIIVLDESDIFSMLEKVEEGGAGADVLRDKYFQLLMQA
jgi:hypothetical protein